MNKILTYTSWLNESITDGVITCDKCGWYWDIVTGGGDPYICHKCDHDNSPSTKTHISVIDKSINTINYGNAPLEFVELAQKTDDTIKNWFIKNSLIEKIKQEAPLNDSKETKNDLEKLLILMKEASGEDISFARYVEDESNLAQSFIDLLKENGYEEDMGGYFRIDSQTESLLFFLKDTINRPRPYQLAKSLNYPLYPLIRTNAMTASYPSGHALSAFVMSKYYSLKYPKVSTELEALGNRIAASREITGIHYPSDTMVSKEICKIIFDNNLLITT
jgi:hypothetical protein